MPRFKPRKGRKFIREEKPEKIFKRMTRDHLDVLQNIEFTILSASRSHSNIDDKIVASALKTAIADGEPLEGLSGLLIKDLENIRLIRTDVSDQIWKDGLKVVLRSVYNHSAAQAGDIDYLDFVSEYVA